MSKRFEAFAETRGVFMSDREDANTALRAARLAGEMMAAATIGIGYGGIYDLDEGCQDLKSYLPYFEIHVGGSASWLFLRLIPSSFAQR